MASTNAKQWWAGLVVGAVVGGLTASIVWLLVSPGLSRAAPEAQVERLLRVQQLELVDAGGATRGRLWVSENGTASFGLANANGDVRLLLIAQGAEGGLAVGGPAGRPIVELLADDTRGILNLHQAQTAMSLLLSHGFTTIQMVDGPGNVVWSAP